MLVIAAMAAAFVLFLGMLLFSEFGRRIGRKRLARDPEGLERGFGAAEGALFALLGLLIAFTFSAAASRFEDRKHLIVDEGNAIGTAWLRLDLLPDDARQPLRALFREYVDARIETYRNVTDADAIALGLALTTDLQNRIWQAAITAVRRPDTPPQAAIVLLPALNEMFDIVTTRLMATRNHTPFAVFFLLAALSFVAALLVGYDTSPNPRRGWLHPVVFAAIVSITVFLIIDLEFPRLGLIRVDATDQLLHDVRAGMDAP